TSFRCSDKFVTALTETLKVFPRKILLRVHGVGVDEFVDRERELVFLEILGSFNIGPSVLALFQNGRIDNFCRPPPSKTQPGNFATNWSFNGPTSFKGFYTFNGEGQANDN
ncbi:1887_t:CDS:1, partial [Paraglomus brasilianum]